MSFFETLEALFDTGLRFAEENPGLFQICQDLKRGAPRRIREQFDNRMTIKWNLHYEKLLVEAVKEGVVCRDLNLKLAAFVVYTLISHFPEFLGAQGKLSGGQREAYLKQCLEIIVRGLKA